MITAAFVTWFVLCLAAAAICSDSKRRELDATMRRHPAWTDDTEAAIEQALAIGDDGRAVVREAERILRDEADA